MKSQPSTLRSTARPVWCPHKWLSLFHILPPLYFNFLLSKIRKCARKHLAIYAHAIKRNRFVLTINICNFGMNICGIHLNFFFLNFFTPRALSPNNPVYSHEHCSIMNTLLLIEHLQFRNNIYEKFSVINTFFLLNE